MKQFLLTLVFVSFLSQTAFTQSFDHSKLDTYFETLAANNKFMGSVAVFKNGSPFYAKQAGFADVANNIKPNANTKYRIGSISKTFTAVLVFKAVASGKLKLTDKLSQYFPEVKNANEITISQLLNHRSGIHNFTDDTAYAAMETKKTSEKELLAVIVAGGSDFAPDSEASYSNPNYILLSLILQKAYKKDYVNLLNEQIIQPLKLKNTYYGKASNIKDNESFSYSPKKNGWEKSTETDMSIPLGAGAIVSTPTDLCLFSDALFNGKLLSNASLGLMKTIKDEYGMGLFQVPFNGRTGYGHTGGIDGFTSVFYHFDDSNVSVALTSNGSNFSNNTIIIALLNAAYNVSQDLTLPVTKNMNLSSADLDPYLGIYASSDIPLKITITKNENVLLTQATGQSILELTATDKDTFSFDRAGIVIVFNPAAHTFLLKQGGREFLFKRE